MKSYLVTTGTLFGLMTAVHVWRIIDEWHNFTTDRGFFMEMAVISVLTTALSVWAWRLLRLQTR